MFSHERLMLYLRWALGIVFLWFGVLKLFNTSPSLDLFKAFLPAVLGESQLFYFVLAVLEIAIGAAFVANKYVRVAVILMILHLIGETVFVLVTQGFTPRFPILSLAGELVLKNVVLISAGLFLIVEKAEKSKEVPAKKEKA